MESTQNQKVKSSAFSEFITDAVILLLTFCAVFFVPYQISEWQKSRDGAPGKIASSQALEAFIAGSTCKADQVSRKLSLGLAITNGDFKLYESHCLQVEAEASALKIQQATMLRISPQTPASSSQ